MLHQHPHLFAVRQLHKCPDFIALQQFSAGESVQFDDKQISRNNTAELFQTACRVFDEMWDGITPLRQLGVQVTRLSNEPYQQYDLFSGMSPQQFEKKLRLDETVDALRDKFGEDILRRGKFANLPGAHMAGGLDKARRTGVTKPVPDEF